MASSTYGSARYGSSTYCVSTPVDHVREAHLQVWRRWRRLPNFRALSGIIGKRMQLMSDELEEIRALRNIDLAFGAHLDAIGDIEGQPRNGFGDTVYRSLIKARVIANRSKGTSEELISAAVFIRGGVSTDVQFEPLYPAAIRLSFLNSTETVQHQALIAQILSLAVFGGVRLYVTFSTTTPFGFDGDPDSFGFGVGHFTTLYAF